MSERLSVSGIWDSLRGNLSGSGVFVLRPGQGMFARTLMLSCALIFCVVALFGGLLIPYQRQVLLRGLGATARVVATSISEVTVSSIILEDFSSVVDHCLKVVKERPTVQYVVITRSDGLSLIHTRTRWERTQKAGDWTPKKIDPEGRILYSELVGAEVFHCTIPLRYSGIDWGWIHIGLSMTDFHRDLRAMVQTTLMLAVPSMLLGLFLSLVFVRRLAEPLRALTSVTEQLRRGELSARAEIKTKDEFQILGDSFNRMASALQKSQARLRSARETDDVVRAMTDSLIVLETDGTIRSVNEGCCHLLGRLEEELVGSALEHWVEDGKSLPDLAGLGSGGAPQTREVVVSRKDGVKRSLLLTLSAIQSSDGTLWGLVGVGKDITAQKEAESSLKQSLKEKELLLREVHHRVKNNLQVITSLLRLQSASVKDPEMLEIFKESQNRIRSMALIHERLYRSKDLESIDFKDYLEGLIKGLFRSYANRADLETVVEIDEVHLGIDQAIPCGLMVNELVSNAIKHAFPKGRKGKITVALGEKDGQFELDVRDDGIGFPDGFEIEDSDTLGMQMIQMLAEEQLQGSLERRADGGSHFVIRFEGTLNRKRTP